MPGSAKIVDDRVGLTQPITSDDQSRQEGCLKFSAQVLRVTASLEGFT